MADPFSRLYDEITSRKAKSEDLLPYSGGNGRVDRAVDLILNEDFPRSGAILDVGGAIGNLGYALRENFQTRITIDIADGCREAAEAKGNRFICANVDVHGLHNVDDGELDLIVALDFIEHILDPEKFSNECYRTLRPGGKVLINTPNIQYWRHLQQLVGLGIFPHTSGDSEVYHGGHVAFYNLHDLNVIFSQFEQRTIHTRGLTCDPPPPIWLSIAQYRDAAKQLSYADMIFSCRKPL